MVNALVRLEDLLKQANESVMLDFKREIKLSSDGEKTEFAKDVSAFANTKGGNIVYGKDDPKRGGQIVGIDPDSFESEKMHQIVSKRCYPPVDFEAELISVESRWFALLSISESPLKPHEIVGTRDVWIRRGDITDKATTKEIMRMPEEAKRMRERIGSEEPQPSEETSLVAFEERAITASMLSLYVLCYLPVRLWTFWALGKGRGLSNWFSFEALVYPFVPLIIIWVLRSLFGGYILKKSAHFLRRVSVPYFVSLVLFVLSMLLLNTSILLYPESTSIFFKTTWLDFLVISIESLGIAIATIIASSFLITQYLAKLENSGYMRDPVKEAKWLIREWKQRMKPFQNKFSIGVMLGLLFLATGIVPIDIGVGLFTPIYHMKEESFSHIFYDVCDVNFLFIYSERINPDIVHSECGLYRLAQRQYTIFPAKVPLLNAIRIPNPTNVSAGSTENPDINAISSDKSVKNLGYVYVTSDTRNIDYRFVPVDYNFTHIELEFSEVSEPFIANVSYWKFLEHLNVSVTTEPRYYDLGNGTWLEAYTYIIVNNEDVPLEVMALEFDRFLYSMVNATTVKVYSQGQLVDWPTFVYARRRLGIWLRIGSGVKLNLTITFQSSDIN